VPCRAECVLSSSASRAVCHAEPSVCRGPCRARAVPCTVSKSRADTVPSACRAEVCAVPSRPGVPCTGACVVPKREAAKDPERGAPGVWRLRASHWLPTHAEHVCRAERVDLSSVKQGCSPVHHGLLASRLPAACHARSTREVWVGYFLRRGWMRALTGPRGAQWSIMRIGAAHSVSESLSELREDGLGPLDLEALEELCGGHGARARSIRTVGGSEAVMGMDGAAASRF
jgi:hypothetical protein